jgi:Holliday junction resolvasome RuvABC endonuclease subunit
MTLHAQAYIGIDPSVTHTGLIILNRDGTILTQQAIVTKPVKCWRDQVARQQKIVSQIKTTIDQTMKLHGMAVIFVEDYAPSRYAKSSIPTIELGGLLRAMLAKLPDEVQFVSPATIKKFVTGKGNADKLAVAVALSKRFNVDFGSDDNIWDAYGLALFALAWDGHCDRLIQAQIEVVAKARKGALNGKA